MIHTQPTEKPHWRRRNPKLGFCLGVVAAQALGLAAPAALAQDPATMDKLAKENEDLRKRLEVLEGIAQKEGILPADTTKTKLVTALSEISISGFVQASYFYDLNEPDDGKSDGYLWNTSHNSFSINKVKVTLASPAVEKDKWDAGFRASLIWGEDSPNLNTGSPMAGFEALREAYAEVNVPIGSGLNVRAGQLISLLNWESGDGGAANPNFSQGFQWWFTGNGPSAGAQLGYSFGDAIDLKVRAQNGMFAGPVDANNGKAFIGSLGIKPTEKLWFNVIGWFSEESTTTDVMGASIIGGWAITERLGTGWEFDYFSFDAGVTDSEVWSMGGWIWYDFSSKFGLAFRADYLDYPDGVPGPPVRPGAGIFSPDPDGNIGSLTLTFNWKPLPNLKIQPEIRYDYTSYSGFGGMPGALDGKEDRFLIGAGISYLF